MLSKLISDDTVYLLGNYTHQGMEFAKKIKERDEAIIAQTLEDNKKGFVHVVLPREVGITGRVSFTKLKDKIDFNKDVANGNDVILSASNNHRSLLHNLEPIVSNLCNVKIVYDTFSEEELSSVIKILGELTKGSITDAGLAHVLSDGYNTLILCGSGLQSNKYDLNMKGVEGHASVTDTTGLLQTTLSKQKFKMKSVQESEGVIGLEQALINFTNKHFTFAPDGTMKAKLGSIEED